MNKNLVLLTADFPFGTGETFLETEIGYLCQAFEKVTIVSSNIRDAQSRQVPKNCIVKRLDLDYSIGLRLWSLVGLFSSEFHSERKVINAQYGIPFSGGILKTALISLERGKRVADYLQSNYSDQLNSTVFYSYWCDDAALGIALAHSQNNAVNGVCRIHRWDVYFEESTVNYLPYRHFIAEHLQKIYTISQDGIDYAVERWKVDRWHFELSRLGIDNDHGPVQPKEDGVFRIASCSNIIPVKRVGLIADALTKITDHCIEWTHIGDGPLREELEDKVKMLPDNISVKLVGRLSNHEVYKLYEELCPNLFINVSSSEGVPVSIMEAMSYGIPVLATDVGGNGEIVNDQNGRLLNPNLTGKELSTIISELIKSSKLSNMRQNAFQTWKEVYEAKTNYQQFTQQLLKS